MRAKRAKAIRRAEKVGEAPRKQSAANQRLLAFTRKFLLAAALTLIPVSVMPEAWFAPLNRVAAVLVGEVLRAWSLAPVVRQSVIGIDGFSVSVIAECSAVHLMALMVAFVYAFPASRQQRWIGSLAGVAVLFSVNLLRIALVAVIGRYFPSRFEIAHVYFGQMGMLVVTMSTCVVWCRWVSRPEGMNGPFGFLARFVLFSSVPFLLWVPLNRIYIIVIDGFVRWLFSLVSLRLMIPHAHALYYQTFSFVALVGLLMAVKGAKFSHRLCWMAGGIAALTVLQVAIRLCNVWISALGMHWVMPISQIVYNVCVYLLPLGIAIHFYVRTEDRKIPVIGDETKR